MICPDCDGTMRRTITIGGAFGSMRPPEDREVPCDRCMDGFEPCPGCGERSRMRDAYCGDECEAADLARVNAA